MTEEDARDWARETDPLFTFLGIYLSTFQWIEGALDQIILLAAGSDKWAVVEDRLARMDNRSKVDAAAAVAVNEVVFPMVGRIKDWTKRVGALTDRLHEERKRRNRIMHSQYLMEGVEHGLPAVRSLRSRSEKERPFDQEELSRSRMDEILAEMAELALLVGMITVQLRQAIPRPSISGADD